MVAYDFEGLKKLVQQLLEELEIDEKYLEFCNRTPNQAISQQLASDLLYTLHPLKRIKTNWPGSK